MEMALTQQMALRNPQLLCRPSSSLLSHHGAGTSQRCAGCGESGLAFRTPAAGSRGLSSSSVWNYRQARRGTFLCNSSGGTRRDDAKQVAKTQKRRARHVKGVTPTKEELRDQLQAEEDAEFDLDRYEAEGEAAGTEIEEEVEGLFEDAIHGSSGDAESSSKPESEASDEFVEEDFDETDNEDLNSEEERWDQAVSGSSRVVPAGEKSYKVQYFPEGKGGAEASEALQEAGEQVGETVGNVSDVAQDTAQDVSGQAQDAAQDVGSTVEDAADTTGKRLGKAGDQIQGKVQGADDVGQAARGVSNVAQDTASDVSNVAQETAEDVGSTVQETAESAGESLSEAGDDVRETVEEGTEELRAGAAEVGENVQETAQFVAETAGETAQEVGSTLQEIGGTVGQTLEEVGETVSETSQEALKEGQKILDEGAREQRGRLEQSRQDLEENLQNLGKQAEEAGDRAGKALEKISDEAGKSLETVQESLSKLADDPAKTAGDIVDEALRFGEVVIRTAGEAAGFVDAEEELSTSDQSSGQVRETATTQSTGAQNGRKAGGIYTSPSKGKSLTSSEEETGKEENAYTGLKVTVAGASGRTGRFLVQELVRKGTTVRALVRDKKNRQARALANLSNVEVVQVDLYNYEAVKKSLGDSNVVISAIGARTLPIDPIGTYQAEYEGVINLVAAAKNKGDVKKFVFITSLGVTFLQFVPLIFWKKQAELYLQRSGLDYTIVRPGGLTDRPNTKEAITMKPADTQFGGTISRQKVAEVCVAALVTSKASEKTVEIVSGRGSGRSYEDLFGRI